MLDAWYMRSEISSILDGNGASEEIQRELAEASRLVNTTVRRFVKHR